MTTSTTQKLNDWGMAVAKFGGTANQWLRYNSYVYRDIDFVGKSVVDIGGGVGRASYYAAAAGARHIVCVEPEASGSRDTMLQTARALGETLRLDKKVDFIAKPVEDIDFKESFDIVLVHNSINHIDEEACARLHVDPEAREKYQAFFKQLAQLCISGGQVVITDCSNRNLFHSLGIRNPVAPTINWRIHQTPEMWAELLAEHGFHAPIIRWTPDRRTGLLGELFLANRWASYCLQSHFCLTMTRI